MICPGCKTNNTDGAVFCNGCGRQMAGDENAAAPARYGSSPPVRMMAPERSMSVMSLVAFILCFVFPPVGMILGVVGIILVATSKGRKWGLGFAIAAIVVGFFFSGIFAAVSIPAFINYMKKAKTSEATFNVDRCYEGVVSYYDTNGQQLPASSDWTPAAPPSDKKYPAPDPGFSRPPWIGIGFSVDEPHYYRYQLAVEGEYVYCRAQGDLDGDGEMSLFERAGIVTENGTLQGSSGIYKSDPLE